MKKTVSVILCIALLLSVFSVTAFAAESGEESTSYPFIFVHGMGGWGSDGKLESTSPYWGNTQNLMDMLRSEGNEVYNPGVGPFSSAWDRACELYAQLTGTVVDYGEKHSSEMKHARYGKDYTGKATMGEPWDMSTPVNLVGHSFGGVTVRLLASLLVYGDEHEKTDPNCSELFKGGHTNAVHSVTTLSAPHNGSVVSNYFYDSRIIVFLMGLLSNYTAVTGKEISIMSTWDMNLDQWGLTGENAKFSLKNAFRFAKAKDNCGYDLTIRGAAEINKKIKTVENAYYYSYTSSCTEENMLGYQQVAYDSMYSIFKLSSTLINLSQWLFVDGVFLDKSWSENDGIVPLKSGLYPFTDENNHDDFVTAQEIKPGIWYTMPTLYGTDHYDFCQADAGDIEGGYMEFYNNMIKTVNAN